MKHLRPLNKKARRIDAEISPGDVVALQNPAGPGAAARPHVPMGCALSFSPGWEVDSAGGTAGLCQPVRLFVTRYVAGVVALYPAQIKQPANRAEKRPRAEPDSTTAQGLDVLDKRIPVLRSRCEAREDQEYRLTQCVLLADDMSHNDMLP